jgi:transposase
VLCELVAGGLSKGISASKAAKLLDGIEPSGAVEAARKEFACELLEDLRQLDQKLKDVRRRLFQVVEASGSSTTEIFGVGPVVAAMVVGITRDVRRFQSSDRFAAYNGTAPIEVSSGPNKVYRLSRRGNRQMNHAIHMAAVTQIRNRGSDGRGYYDRKIAEGMSGKSALRALKRRISGALYAAMVTDARRAGLIVATGPGGQAGNGSLTSVAGFTPRRPALRRSHSRARSNSTTTPRPARRGRRRIKSAAP